jgi:hypothetical protein
MTGDIIVAMNGDRRAGRVPSQALRMFLRDSAYTLTVRRGNTELTIPLTSSVVASAESWRSAWSVFFVGLVFCVIYSIVAALRPDRPIARLAFVAGMSTGLVLLSNAAGFSTPWMPHIQAVATKHYFHLRRFTWRSATTFICVSLATSPADGDGEACEPCSTVCAARSRCGASSASRCLPGASGRISIFGPAHLRGRSPRCTERRFAQIITCVGVVAVLWRNYRIRAGRRRAARLRWVLWGTIAGVAPFLSVAVMRLIAIGVPSLMPMIAPWIFVANVATILIPFSFAYAIAKHHVFDITVVLRRGVQYLLAQNALRGLVSLPLIGLGVGVVRHRNEPIGLLLVSHSPYLYLAVGAALSLQFRGQLSRWIDRRFFREAYDRERMLLNLMSDAERLDSGSAMWKVVSHELQSAFHPTCLFVWYREAAASNLTLSYSSGGYIHTAQLSLDSPLAMLARRDRGVIRAAGDRRRTLPTADRAWLDEAGVRLIVPIIGADHYLAGMLMLGDKKSEEPYSPDDLTLLRAIARQIAVGRENVRLKERVDQ